MQHFLRVGLIGTGMISGAYLKMAAKLPFAKVIACADLSVQAAHAKASEFGIRACTVDAMLSDPAIDLILNLTIPKAHAAIALRALESGKHVYNEKPLAGTLEDGRKILALAKEKNLHVGCAPDTFLGSGLQTARKLIDEGAIGRPVAFTAFMLSRGHEHWHPSPEFYYQPGGGPMLDMGPYYVTALLNLLGPVERIMGMTTISRPVRTILSQPKFGTVIPVNCPDHVLGLMEFENGAAGTIIQSFATRGGTGTASPIVIYGTEGTLRVPDPNNFDDPVLIARFGENNPNDEFEVAPPTFAIGYGRHIGVADMAHAITNGRPHRCSGEQALAVLEIMLAFSRSSETGQAIAPAVPFTRPAPLPADLSFGRLD